MVEQMTHEVQWTTPLVWHKLPTDELKIAKKRKSTENDHNLFRCEDSKEDTYALLITR